MTPYVILILTIVILTIIDFQTNKIFTTKIMLIAFFILLLFAGLRGNGDGDYNVYKYLYSQFTTFPDLFKNSHIEPGFRLLSILLNKFGFGPQSIIFTMNLISISSVFYIINVFSKNKVLSILAFLPFYFMFDMQTARSAVAIGLTLVAYSYLISNKFKKYFLFITFATFFHVTALISLIILPLVYYFKKKDNININHILIFIIVLLIFGLSIRYFDLLGKIVLLINNDYLTKKYNWYIASPYTYPYSLLDPRFIFTILQFLVYGHMYKNKKTKNVYLYSTLILALVNTFLFSTFTILVIRLGSYFTIYSILIVPEIFEFISNDLLISNSKHIPFITINSQKKILLTGYVLFYLLFLYGVLNGYYSYRLFF